MRPVRGRRRPRCQVFDLVARLAGRRGDDVDVVLRTLAAGARRIDVWVPVVRCTFGLPGALLVGASRSADFLAGDFLAGAFLAGAFLAAAIRLEAAPDAGFVAERLRAGAVAGAATPRVDWRDVREPPVRPAGSSPCRVDEDADASRGAIDVIFIFTGFSPHSSSRW